MIVVEDVTISKQRVTVGEKLLISVTIVHNKYLHTKSHVDLSAYTHRELRLRGHQDSRHIDLTTQKHDELHVKQHIQIREGLFD